MSALFLKDDYLKILESTRLQAFCGRVEGERSCWTNISKDCHIRRPIHTKQLSIHPSPITLHPPKYRICFVKKGPT